MGAKRRRSWKVLIIPDDESGVRQYRLTQIGLTALIGIAALLVLYAAAETILFWVVAKRAAEVEPLRQRVSELESSGDKAAQLGVQLAELRSLEQQIRRMMAGGRTDLSESVPWDRTGQATGQSSMESYPRTPDSRVSVNPVADARGVGKASFTAMDVPTLPPVRGYVTRRFTVADSDNPLAHYGLDIAAAEGTPVRAAADGLVVFADWTYRYGNLAVIQHRSDFVSFYGHNQVLLVQPGERVRQGEPIALVGNSGLSTAPHLHFELWHGGSPVDPTSLLARLP
ncbi:M23 family metallopeptidase [bacterium]|nr:M23 family metallopeptidase [bacterium]MBU1983691.1 M23 family metallopeptidase [bacterium]